MNPGQLKIPTAARIKIKNARVARLATVDQHGHPHVVPICFAICGGVFYTAVDLKTKRVPPKDLARVRNIRTTPQVALVLDEYSEDWDRLWYVLVRGTARLIPESPRNAPA